MQKIIQKEYDFRIPPSLTHLSVDRIRVIIKKANDEENLSRDEYLKKIIEYYINFIESGKHNTSFEWERELNNSRFINDKRNRLEFSKKYIMKDIHNYDVNLALIEWNLEGDDDDDEKNTDKSNYRKFRSHQAYDILPIEMKGEIYNRVLEMNPLWSGGIDKAIKLLNSKFPFEQAKSNFTDLSLTSQSVFFNSKSYIRSLLEEIKTHVFENIGTIQSNISVKELGLREVIPTPENIILKFFDNDPLNKNLRLKGYIGVVEHGNFELKIVVKREKSYNFECDIKNIVQGLRSAIIWWKEHGAYTEEEIEMLESQEAVYNPRTYNRFLE